MDQQPQLNEAGVVRIAQIVTGAMILGVLFFAGIAFANAHGRPPGDPMLGYVAIVISAICVVLSFIVPGIAAGQTLRQQSADTSDNKYYAGFQTKVIVRAALLEGPAFFCGIAYMVTHILWAIGLMLALVALMLVFFPTRGRLDDWTRERRELDSLEQ
jgi:hypothetical protein